MTLPYNNIIAAANVITFHLPVHTENENIDKGQTLWSAFP